jgi:hypothetical protein
LQQILKILLLHIIIVINFFRSRFSLITIIIIIFISFNLVKISQFITPPPPNLPPVTLPLSRRIQQISIERLANQGGGFAFAGRNSPRSPPPEPDTSNSNSNYPNNGHNVSQIIDLGGGINIPKVVRGFALHKPNPNRLMFISSFVSCCCVRAGSCCIAAGIYRDFYPEGLKGKKAGKARPTVIVRRVRSCRHCLQEIV